MASSPNRTTLATKFMPMAGIGCWQTSQGEVGMDQVIEWALDAGVRLIDTAYMYQNEEQIGKALDKFIKSGKVKREELFVVTKLPLMAMHPEDVETYFEMSRKALKLDYIDLYLVGTNVGMHKDEKTLYLKYYEGGKVKFDMDTDLISIWKEMEKLVEKGKCHSIGVSNWHSEQLERITGIAKIPIAANQVECNAYFQQRKLRETMDRLNIRMMSYGSLGSPGRRELWPDCEIPDLLGDKLVLELSKKHGKTPAQILLRHLVQLDIIVIPKSVTQHRLQDNYDIFDFSLNDDDMARLNALDKGYKAKTFTVDMFKTDDDIDQLPEKIVIERDMY